MGEVEWIVEGFLTEGYGGGFFDDDDDSDIDGIYGVSILQQGLPSCPFCKGGTNDSCFAGEETEVWGFSGKKTRIRT